MILKRSLVAATLAAVATASSYTSNNEPKTGDPDSYTSQRDLAVDTVMTTYGFTDMVHREILPELYSGCMGMDISGPNYRETFTEPNSLLYCVTFAEDYSRRDAAALSARRTMMMHLIKHWGADFLATVPEGFNAPAELVMRSWNRDDSFEVANMLVDECEIVEKLDAANKLDDFLAAIANKSYTGLLAKVLQISQNYSFLKVMGKIDLEIEYEKVTALLAQRLSDEEFLAVMAIPTTASAQYAPEGHIANEFARRGIPFQDRRAEHAASLEVVRDRFIYERGNVRYAESFYVAATHYPEGAIYNALMSLIPLWTEELIGYIAAGAMSVGNFDLLRTVENMGGLDLQSRFAAIEAAAKAGRLDIVARLFRRDTEGLLRWYEVRRGGSKVNVGYVVLEATLENVYNPKVGDWRHYYAQFAALAKLPGHWGRYFNYLDKLFLHQLHYGNTTDGRLTTISYDAAGAMDRPFEQVVPEIFNWQRIYNVNNNNDISILQQLKEYLRGPLALDICKLSISAAECHYSQFFREVLALNTPEFKRYYDQYRDQCHAEAISATWDRDMITFLRYEIGTQLVR